MPTVIVRNKENLITIISLMLLALIITMSSHLSFRYPTLQINASVKGVLLLSIIFINALLNRMNYTKPFNFYIDLISILLLFRLGHYIFVTLYIGKFTHMSNLLAVSLAFFTYIWTTNININLKIFVRWCESIVIIIGIQTIIAVLEGLKNGFPLFMLKSYITTPIGSSNSITTFLLLLLPIIYKLEQSAALRNLLLLFTITIIFLTRSNSGIITLCLLIGSILLLEKKHRLLKIAFLCIAFSFIIYFISLHSSEYLLRLSETLTMLLSKDSRNLNTAFNGRFQIYAQAIALFQENPFIGNGFSYRQFTNDLMTHNWILEALVSGGIISLISSLIIFLTIVYQIIKEKNLDSKFKECIILCLFTALFQGMIEPSIGTMNFDLIFWIIMGHGIYVCHHHKSARIKDRFFKKEKICTT